MRQLNKKSFQAKCLRSATKEVKCKEVSRSKDGAEGDSSTSFVHHWVSGNLPLMSECEVCEQGCGDSTQDEDLRCAWCQRTVHKACQSRFGDVCDLVKYCALNFADYSQI